MKACLLLVCIATIGCASVPAKEPEAVRARRHIVESPEDLSAKVRESVEPADALFDASFIEGLWDAWDGLNRRLYDSTRLWIGINYTAVFQHASASLGPRDAAGGDLDVFGRWQAIEKKQWPGLVYFHLETRHRYTSIAPKDLGGSIGSLWGTTTDFDTQDLAMVQLYWSHGSFESGLEYRVGKMDPSLLFDVGRYVSDNFAFLSGAFSDTLPMALPDAGLGAVAAFYPYGDLYLMAGLHDANASRTSSGFSTLFDQHELFVALEAGYAPRFGEVGEGLYHVTLWHTDNRDQAGVPSGKGIAFTAERELGAEGTWVPFVRYAYGEGANLAVEQLLAVGLGIEEVFDENEDVVGIALAWGRPSDRTRRDQYTFEIFYRVHITPHLKLTPDLQVILDPSLNPTEDVIYVLGLRARVVF